MSNSTILFIKSISPILYSAEEFALNVRDDPKYDNNPLINKNAIDEAFKLYGSVLNPTNRTNLSYANDYNINIEGHFLATHLPEIPSIVSDKTCTVNVLHEYMKKHDNITHIGLTAYATGLENAIEVIQAIQKDYPHVKLFIGGVGALYPHVKKIVLKKDICIGEGVNWLRRKFDLKPLSREEFVIPEIAGNISALPIPVKTNYMVTQLGCPNSCDFCITPLLHDYFPFSDSEKIIQYIDNIYFSSNKDVFIYICDPNAFYPEGTWKKVFNHYIINHRQYERNIFISCLASLNHLSKFNLKEIQASPLKLFLVNFGIESGIKQYPKNIGNPKKMVDLLNELNIFTFHTFIIGFPFHTPEGVRQDIAANLEYNSDRHFLHSVRPIPNTILYNQLKGENRLFLDKLPPEFVYTFEYMPFYHEHLGFGFDILKYCFYAYYETEKVDIDYMGRFATKLLNLCENTSSRKLRRLASALINVSDANFISFKKRMPENLIEKYETRSVLNRKKYKNLRTKR